MRYKPILINLSWLIILLVGTVGCNGTPNNNQCPYGSNQCLPGYVWREAFPKDYVCVSGETRSQAAFDNSQANARRDPNCSNGDCPYGTNQCLPGYVWREAFPGDYVCVSGETRSQAALDNSQADARRDPKCSEPAPASCANFSGYTDDQRFGNPFTLDGYRFTGLGAEPFVNVSGGIVGLQFPGAGLEIDLPGPASAVDLTAASTATPLTIMAFDGNGVVVTTANVPADHAAHNITLSGQNILKIKITGGNYEGMLVKICHKSLSKVCVDFEPPLVLGTKYGTPSGQNPGGLAFTTANGIPVTVWDFNSINGGSNFGLAYIDSAPLPSGSGQNIRSNNINLEFDFSRLGFQASQVQFEFLDLGGFENIAVNGGPIFAGELSAAPNPINGVNYNIVKNPVRGGYSGTMTLSGAVQRVRIGGQEFWIDNVCVSK